jgi:hypothetical protein
MSEYAEKGIFIQLKGGLGNQMFQLVAGYIASIETKCPLYYIKQTNRHNPHQISHSLYSDTIFKNIGLAIDASNPAFHTILSTIFSSYKEHPTTMLRPFQLWNPTTLYPGTILNGYYQNYVSLKPYEKEIRFLFTSRLYESIKLTPQLKAHFNSAVFLHIRRGDYVEKSDDFYLTPVNYYDTALHDLRTKLKSPFTVYILSDDIQYCKSIEIFQSSEFVFIESKNELESLAIMSLCKAGAICANSTFSWWGAFLGAYESRSPVYIPSPWIKNTSVDSIDFLFPQEWIQVKYDS